MRVVHHTDAGDTSHDRQILASTVEVADSTLSQAKGLMFRRSIPDDYALVMELGNGGGLVPFTDGPSRQFVHMLGMRFPIDVLWLVDQRVTKAARLAPWTGAGLAKANRIIELPAGAAEDVSAGENVFIEGLDEDAG